MKRSLIPLKSGIILIIISLTSTFVAAQTSYKVLHYTETSGFDHQTRVNSLALFQSFSNIQVTDDQTGASFDTLAKLQQFDLIVFSNTSGDQILDSTQQSHFEKYMQQGGNLVGLHAATDTYRHSTANGNNTGAWDYYAETIGGSVQQSPNHVVGTPAYDINKIGTHPSTDSLPNPWNKNEEYYYWENGFLDTNINVVLEVEQTIGPNNQVNSYDSARAVSWTKEMTNGSRIFYTSTGHANSSFTTDTLFEKHIENAVKWCLATTTSINPIHVTDAEIKIYPNPTQNFLQVELELIPNSSIKVHSIEGRLILEQNITSSNFQLNLKHLKTGVYFLEFNLGNKRIIHKIIKE